MKLTDAERMEVVEIMEMYSVLKHAHEALNDKRGIDVTFLGFDGNNEREQMSYALFLVEKEGKFGSLYRDEGLNSHWPMLPRYRRMLKEWEALDKRHDLTKGELVRITEAGNPDQQ